MFLLNLNCLVLDTFPVFVDKSRWYW